MTEKKTSRQYKHQRKVLSEGGTRVDLLLRPEDKAHLEHIKARDGIKTSRKAIIQSIQKNADSA